MQSFLSVGIKLLGFRKGLAKSALAGVWHKSQSGMMAESPFWGLDGPPTMGSVLVLIPPPFPRTSFDSPPPPSRFSKPKATPIPTPPSDHQVVDVVLAGRTRLAGRAAYGSGCWSALELLAVRGLELRPVDRQIPFTPMVYPRGFRPPQLVKSCSSAARLVWGVGE